MAKGKKPKFENSPADKKMDKAGQKKMDMKAKKKAKR